MPSKGLFLAEQKIRLHSQTIKAGVSYYNIAGSTGSTESCRLWNRAHVIYPRIRCPSAAAVKELAFFRKHQISTVTQTKRDELSWLNCFESLRIRVKWAVQICSHLVSSRRVLCHSRPASGCYVQIAPKGFAFRIASVAEGFRPADTRAVG